ncbi:MAG: hypothetical protein VB099_15325 [Candidatus Limiplasma sp.]|nr:hypothetical protein [Candidatus Limiplasma sp.]
MKKVWIGLLCAMLAFTLASCQGAPDATDNAPTPEGPAQEQEGQINGVLGWRLA